MFLLTESERKKKSLSLSLLTESERKVFREYKDNVSRKYEVQHTWGMVILLSSLYFQARQVIQSYVRANDVSAHMLLISVVGL